MKILSGRYVRTIVIAGLMLGLMSLTLRCEETTKATVCELKVDPARFEQKLIQVVGFVSHGFEDFGLFDPSCPSWPYVWREYGERINPARCTVAASPALEVAPKN